MRFVVNPPAIMRINTGLFTQSDAVPSDAACMAMDFPAAMQAVIAGKKIHKLEWNNKAIYAVLNGGFLKIVTSDGKLHEWMISEVDLNGNDYILV